MRIDRKATLRERFGTLLPPSVPEFLLLTAICVVAIAGSYAGLDARDLRLAAQHHSFFAPALALDARVPFAPWMVVFYLSYFPAFFAPMLVTTADRRVALEGTVGYVAVAALSLAIFWALPSRMDQPDLSGCHSWACATLRVFYEADHGFRIFPSLHVAYPTLVWLYFRRYLPAMRWPFGALVLGIWASTVTLKRHYLLDIPAGVLTALAGYGLSRFVAPRLEALRVRSQSSAEPRA